MAREIYSYDRRWTPRIRQAGGIDVQEDIYKLLPAMAASASSFDSKDLAYATYVFDGLKETDPNPAVKKFAEALAVEYAHRFAKWLGYVFMNRANRKTSGKLMNQLKDGLAEWVEAIPEIIRTKSKKPLTSYVSKKAVETYLNPDKINRIGAKILSVVYKDWIRAQSRTASGLDELPITYNRGRSRYEIPVTELSFDYRDRIKDLGFDWDRGAGVWHMETLDTDAIRALPQVTKLRHRPMPSKGPPVDPSEWFFDEWLPRNIDRFTKVFNDYGRTEGVPYEFRFTVTGDDVEVKFQRNITDVGKAVAEIEARYGDKEFRAGWIEAVEAWKALQRVSGSNAMGTIDMANDLEHSHGSMLEHFPPGVKKWYPKFLDFKFSAHPWQMIRAIRDEDLRTIATELMPLHFRKERLVTPQTDYRTARGLATEIAAENGKTNKIKRLRQVKHNYPEMYDEVVAALEEKGLGNLAKKV